MLSVSKQSFSKTLAKLCVAVFCRYALIESNVESVNGLEGTHGAAPSSFGAVSTAHIHT